MTKGDSHASAQLRTNGKDVIERIFGSWGAGGILTELRGVTDGVYLVGGSVRDFILASPPSDLDLIVPNGQPLVDMILARYGVCKVNRHGNRHYRLGNGLKIDVIEPRNFYRPFQSANDVLSFFDTSVNAIGVNIATGHLLDPLDGSHDLASGVVRLPQARWTSMNAFESVHLLLRLCRLLERHDLHVIDTARAEAIVPLVWEVDWSDLARLHGLSRSAAARRIDQTILQRSAVPSY